MEKGSVPLGRCRRGGCATMPWWQQRVRGEARRRRPAPLPIVLRAARIVEEKPYPFLYPSAELRAAVRGAIHVAIDGGFRLIRELTHMAIPPL